MSQTFLIADLHLSHRKILEFEKDFRPYKDIDEHDLALKNNWNSVVGESDIVYVLGDVAFSRPALNSLGTFKGKKILVGGNHDKFSTRDYLYVFDNIYGACRIGDIILTHIPIHPEEMRWVGGNIHGHRHSKANLPGKYLCVSCEHIDMTPITLDECKLRMEINSHEANRRNS